MKKATEIRQIILVGRQMNDRRGVGLRDRTTHTLLIGDVSRDETDSVVITIGNTTEVLTATESDDFFDAVTVNVDDPALRENRLKLLNKIRSALDGVADFSRIEG